MAETGLFYLKKVLFFYKMYGFRFSFSHLILKFPIQNFFIFFWTTLKQVTSSPGLNFKEIYTYIFFIFLILFFYIVPFAKQKIELDKPMKLSIF